MSYQDPTTFDEFKNTGFRVYKDWNPDIDFDKDDPETRSHFVKPVVNDMENVQDNSLVKNTNNFYRSAHLQLPDGDQYVNRHGKNKTGTEAWGSNLTGSSSDAFLKKIFNRRENIRKIFTNSDHFQIDSQKYQTDQEKMDFLTKNRMSGLYANPSYVGVQDKKDNSVLWGTSKRGDYAGVNINYGIDGEKPDWVDVHSLLSTLISPKTKRGDVNKRGGSRSLHMCDDIQCLRFGHHSNDSDTQNKNDKDARNLLDFSSRAQSKPEDMKTIAYHTMRNVRQYQTNINIDDITANEYLFDRRNTIGQDRGFNIPRGTTDITKFKNKRSGDTSVASAKNALLSLGSNSTAPRQTTYDSRYNSPYFKWSPSDQSYYTVDDKFRIKNPSYPEGAIFGNSPRSEEIKAMKTHMDDYYSGNIKELDPSLFFYFTNISEVGRKPDTTQLKTDISVPRRPSIQPAAPAKRIIEFKPKKTSSLVSSISNQSQVQKSLNKLSKRIV